MTDANIVNFIATTENLSQVLRTGKLKKQT